MSRKFKTWWSYNFGTWEHYFHGLDLTVSKIAYRAYKKGYKDAVERMHKMS